MFLIGSADLCFMVQARIQGYFDRGIELLVFVRKASLMSHQSTKFCSLEPYVLSYTASMTLDDENEAILLQIQEEQRQFPQRFARRLHQVGKAPNPTC